ETWDTELAAITHETGISLVALRPLLLEHIRAFNDNAPNVAHAYIHRFERPRGDRPDLDQPVRSPDQARPRRRTGLDPTVRA
ncbi:MAG TPA: hypothetical protein DEG43_06870, partial [Acidimicrobiaceae bacterium]|nr:hypothetical protein [Acidimicrobiaceae bacterium]